MWVTSISLLASRGSRCSIINTGMQIEQLIQTSTIWQFCINNCVKTITFIIFNNNHTFFISFSFITAKINELNWFELNGNIRRPILANLRHLYGLLRIQCFWYTHIWECWHSKCMSSSRSTTSLLAPFDGIYHYFIFLTLKMQVKVMWQTPLLRILAPTHTV